MDTENNEGPPQFTTSGAMDKKEPTSKCKARKPHYNETGMDQQKTRQAILFLGQHPINQIEMFTSSHTKMLLLIGCSYINEAGIFTSVPQLVFQCTDKTKN